MLIIAGGRPLSGGGTPPTPGPEIIDTATPAPGGTVGNAMIIWNSDFGAPITIVGGGNNDQLFINANDTQGQWPHGEIFNIAQTAPGTTLFAHLVSAGGAAVTSASIRGIPSVLISAYGGNNKFTIGDLNGAGIASLGLSFGPDHGTGNSVSIVGGSTNDNFTLTAGQDLLPAVPNPSIPNVFQFNAPSSGGTTPQNVTPITVNTVTISRQGVGTIELFGTKAAANDSLSINGKRGNDSFFITAIGIPTTLQGNDATAASATPFTTSFFVGWTGLNSPGLLAGHPGGPHDRRQQGQ